MHDVDVIEDPAVAADLLDPLRAQILAELRQPGSASTLAPTLGQTRQKVNYHLKALESHGLVALVGERPRRGLTERLFQATAQSYVVGPAAVGPTAAAPERTDRLSSRYLIALGARLVTEVADLVRRADDAGKPLATLSIDSDIRFASPTARAAFTDELAATVRDLAARYHDETATDGRWHRLVVAAHPTPPNQLESTS
ncbi:MAG: helix-turn-helix domain-containing protein [Actinomycetota bacterium]